MPESNESGGGVRAVTLALAAIGRGDRAAADELLPLVYQELRRLAAARLAHAARGQTLQATALVHEAWIRVAGERDPGWESRAHFFGAAAQAMREILADRARRRDSEKRGGSMKRESSLDEEMLIVESEPNVDFLALDEALKRLEAEDPRKARVVSLRFFTGLEHEEIARMLDVNVRTVERDWRFARAWLQKELQNK